MVKLPKFYCIAMTVFIFIGHFIIIPLILCFLLYIKGKLVSYPGFLLGTFSRGESIVMQISIVILLFSDQNSGRGESFRGVKLPQGAPLCPPPPPPPWKKASIFTWSTQTCDYFDSLKNVYKNWLHIYVKN